MAAQLTVRKGFWHLRLLLCSSAATSSLPVPVSPVIRMLLSVDASLKRRVLRSRIEALSPMIPLDSARCCEQALAALCSPEVHKHLLTAPTNSSTWKGCLMYSLIPARNAAMARSSELSAGTSTIGVLPTIQRSCFAKSSVPPESTPDGQSMTTSGCQLLHNARNGLRSLACRTSKPLRVNRPDNVP